MLWSDHGKSKQTRFSFWVRKEITLNGRTVTAVSIDSLEETEDDPQIHGGDVQVASEEAVDQGTEDSSSTQDEHLSRVSILGSQTEWCRVLVVDLMNVLVEDTGVESLVGWRSRLTLATS